MYAGSIVYMFHCSYSWKVGVICSSEVHLGIRDQLYTVAECTVAFVSALTLQPGVRTPQVCSIAVDLYQGEGSPSS